jgi:hypothetical protein
MAPIHNPYERPGSGAEIGGRVRRKSLACSKA